MSAFLFLAALSLAGSSPSGEVQDDSLIARAFGTPAVEASRITFRLGDQGECDRATGGVWELAGKTLAIEFAHRIVPHEASRFVLFEDAEITGQPELLLPDDYTCKFEVDATNRSAVLHSFRPDRAPAFPGAEGFGKYTLGGRGGMVYPVTNLDDSGPGSLREACEAEGPRTVVFRVSGTIALKSQLDIEHPFITIAGQTAPGDGICIKDYMLKVETDHVIIRYLRFRVGAASGKEQDSIGAEGDHLIIDHCTASWGVDETLSINKASNVTVQWCMITESLFNSIHKKGHHGYGGLWGGPGGSFHHNILAHHSSRNPRASGNEDSGLLDYRNNVVYNWGFNSAYGGELWPRNWVNNYYKAGPATDSDVRARIFIQDDPRGKMYAAGNHVEGFPRVTKDNWKGIHYGDSGATEETLRVGTPYVVAPVTTHTAEEAYAEVLAHAGASLQRDPVDTRIIEEIRTGTAQYGKSFEGGGNGIIDSPEDVGGWPELRPAEPPTDTDNDGIPDEWEQTSALSPNDPTDAHKDSGDGYTWLEVWMNGLVR